MVCNTTKHHPCRSFRTLVCPQHLLYAQMSESISNTCVTYITLTQTMHDKYSFFHTYIHIASAKASISEYISAAHIYRFHILSNLSSPKQYQKLHISINQLLCFGTQYPSSMTTNKSCVLPLHPHKIYTRHKASGISSTRTYTLYTRMTT